MRPGAVHHEQFRGFFYPFHRARSLWIVMLFFSLSFLRKEADR